VNGQLFTQGKIAGIVQKATTSTYFENIVSIDGLPSFAYKSGTSHYWTKLDLSNVGARPK
jgi:hypothetical protein